MVVQHNLKAMNANRMLGINTKQSASSTEKLSSGYKINRAADNAAGLAISEKMRKQIRGLGQASSNSEDGISCVQTAEGALAEVQDMLQRMNELAVQAANGTNSETDRRYIQDELYELVTEIDRVSETTKFNEIYLLKGDEENKGTYKSWIVDYKTVDTPNPNADIHGEPTTKQNYIGHNTIYFVDDAIDNAASGTPVSARKVQNGNDITPFLNPGKTGVNADYRGFMGIQVNKQVAAANTALGTNQTVIDLIYDATAKKQINAARDLYLYDQDTKAVIHIAKGEKMNDYLNADNGIADGYLLVDTLMGTRVRDELNYDFDNDGNIEPFQFLDGVTIEQDRSHAQLYDADGKKVSAMALYKYFNVDGDGSYEGGLFTSAQADPLSEIKVGDIDVATGMSLIESYIRESSVEVPKDLTFNLHAGADSDEPNKITVEIENLSSSGLGVNKIHSNWIGIVDDTGDLATDMIDVVADALKKVSTQRSLIGAMQNRLEHTIRNLDNVVENTTQAESNIRDTDMAEEMVTYSNNSVLLQAGQSMLAQANQANQGILSLLG